MYPSFERTRPVMILGRIEMEHGDKKVKKTYLNP